MQARLLFSNILLVTICFCCGLTNAFAQPIQNYFIGFKDKIGSPYSLDQPTAFLSERSIARRTRQQIVLSEQDLPVNPTYIQAVQSTGIELLNRSKWMNGITVRIADTNQIASTLQAIASLSCVKNTTAIKRIAQGNSQTQTNDKLSVPVLRIAEGKANTSSDYGYGYNQIHMLNGDYMHQQGFRGKGIQIAVLDAGFKNANQIPAFDSIRTRGQILATHDFVVGDDEVYSDDQHGCCVLSSIACNLPGELIGTAPDASFYLLRSEDNASEHLIEEYNWVSAAEYADSAGADIISSSLGYSTFDGGISSHTYAELDGKTTPVTQGAEAAFARGILVVNSAGNEGTGNWRYIIAPADGDHVMAIGAVDSLGIKANFSSFGPASDGAIKPDVATQGKGTWLADPYGNLFSGNGTSFACPILSGMAACLWQAAPKATNTEIKQAIEQSASQAAAPDFALGNGIPDFAKALYFLRDKQQQDFDTDRILGIYGNPFRDSFGVNFYSHSDQTITLTMLDLLGRNVLHYEKKLQADSFNQLILPEEGDRSHLASGIYYLHMVTPTDDYLLKVLKVNN
jgi:subtilisin family serine protease